MTNGATAAARLRRLDEHANITVVDRGNRVSFANCGLPYHVAGEIIDRNRLMLHTQQSLRSLLNIDIQTRCEAFSIDRQNKIIKVRYLDSNKEETLPYDKLLSPGASPMRPPIEGLASTKNIFT
jgi:NADPH-dependent 2,4-dienoyl-CoA reductase/sulfur reductase-like enzyme